MKYVIAYLIIGFLIARAWRVLDGAKYPHHTWQGDIVIMLLWPIILPLHLLSK
jgi:hypothetical protein